MERFEITNSAAQEIHVSVITYELKKAGAERVRTRHAFGWSNQPHVATFAARDMEQAKAICDAASEYVGKTLIPYQYTGGKWKHNPHTNTSVFIPNE